MTNQLNKFIVGVLHLWAFYDLDQILDENTIELLNSGIIISNCCNHCAAHMFTAEKKDAWSDILL